MRIRIIEEDFNNAGRYTSNGNCLLATALKRLYPTEFINVLSKSFRVGDNSYAMTVGSYLNIENAYGGDEYDVWDRIRNKTPFTVYARLDN